MKAFAGAPFVGPSPCQPGRAERAPNVLFVISDDLNTDLGCYGRTLVKSPNIDGLARRGVRFEYAYCQYPLCNPSRVSFLSGRYPTNLKVLDNLTPPRSFVHDLLTLPQHFRKHGYQVARVGKVFHLEDPPSWADGAPPLGTGRRQSNWNPWVGPLDENDRELIKRLRSFNTPTIVEGNGEAQRDYGTATEATKLLAKLKSGGRPFLLAVGLKLPHVPFEAPKSYYDLYKPSLIRLPRDFVPMPGWKDIPADAVRPNVDLFLKEPATEEKARQLIAAYYACVSFMDAQLGRVLGELNRLGLSDNTIVVFLSDNGVHLGQKGMWAKFTLFEQSARVPLIVLDPRRKTGGSVCRRVVEYVDLFPTLVELCGLPEPAGLDGRSLVPLLDNPTAAWSKPALTFMFPRGRLATSIRTERWRYTEWDNGRRGTELYDHARDPAELKNLAGDPKYASVVAELARFIRASVPL